MSWLLADPLIIPFGTAVLALLFRNSPRGRWIAVAGSGLAFSEVGGHDRGRGGGQWCCAFAAAFPGAGDARAGTEMEVCASEGAQFADS